MILILTFKSIVDLSVSLYLCELVKKKNKSANTRLAIFFLFVCHQLVGAALITFEHPIIYAAPTEWNKLNCRMRKINNFDLLKREVRQNIISQLL